MVMKKYKYGAFKKKIKNLLRRKVYLKSRIRTYKKNIIEVKKKISKINQEINKYLDLNES